jgi:hypothetical protein
MQSCQASGFGLRRFRIKTNKGSSEVPKPMIYLDSQMKSRF